MHREKKRKETGGLMWVAQDGMRKYEMMLPPSCDVTVTVSHRERRGLIAFFSRSQLFKGAFVTF